MAVLEKIEDILGSEYNMKIDKVKMMLLVESCHGTRTEKTREDFDVFYRTRDNRRRTIKAFAEYGKSPG